MTISRPLLLTFAFLLGLAVTVSGQTPRSPFGNGPKAANGPAANADAQPLTLSGVIRTGSGTLVCITTTGDRRSHWIKVGDKSDGIEVLRHDPATHAVVVAYDNREISLGLKQAPVIPVESRPIYTSTPALTGPAPVAGVATSVAVTNEEKEREARFLVSDLLEIGMIQRQAYQEAKDRELADQRKERPQDQPPAGNATQR